MKFEFKNELESATLYIFDNIGSSYWEINANDIEEELKNANNKPLNIHINSNGGEVFEGFTIYNLIKGYSGQTTVYVDGLAASIASVIALAGDKVIMNKASMLMIHNASGGCYGNAEEMKKVVEALEKINSVIKDIYVAKTGLSIEKLTELMDNETFMTPSECLEYGFCDEVIDEEPTSQSQKITTESMENLRNTIEKKIKDFKDLRSALFFVDNKDEEHFLNKKKNHDWLRKEFI